MADQRFDINFETISEPFDSLQREVPFAPFQSAHVGAMDAEEVGEGFLAEAFGVAYGTHVGADSTL